MRSQLIGRVHLIEGIFLSELVYATLIIIDGVSSHREPNNGELFMALSSTLARTPAFHAGKPGSTPGSVTICLFSSVVELSVHTRSVACSNQAIGTIAG